MRKKIGAVLTALVLLTGAGVATATAAEASTRIGPFSSLAVCQQSQAAYQAGGRTVIHDCWRPGDYGTGFYFAIV